MVKVVRPIDVPGRSDEEGVIIISANQTSEGTVFDKE